MAAAVVILVLLIVAALPLWFPTVLRSVGSRHGLTYEKVEREGYGTFTLSGVGLTDGPVVFHADTFHAFQPSTWLWKLRDGIPTGNFASANGWSLNLSTAHGGTANAVPNSVSVYTNFDRVEQVVAQLRRWLPTASLTNGVINVEGKQIFVPELHLNRSEASGSFSMTNFPGEFAFRLRDTNRLLHLHLENKSLELSSDILVLTNASGIAVQSTNTWQSNVIVASGLFEREGSLPSHAEVSAQGIMFRLQSSICRITNCSSGRCMEPGKKDCFN